ncbi:MAG: hypothetical protein QM705_12045 [Ancrocorticia sp.]
MTIPSGGYARGEDEYAEYDEDLIGQEDEKNWADYPGAPDHLDSPDHFSTSDDPASPDYPNTSDHLDSPDYLNTPDHPNAPPTPGTAATPEPRDPSIWRLAFTDARRAYRFPALLLPIFLMAVAAAGAADGIRDVHGDYLLGALPMFAPAVLSVWWAVRGAFERELTLPSLLVRLLSASLYVPIPLIASILCSVAGVWSVPANRAFLDGASHYWWSKTLGSAIIKTGTAPLGEQLLITGLMGLVIASFAGLMASIFILLPVVALRRREVFGFTLTGQGNTAAYVFDGFAMIVAGGALVIFFGEGLRFSHVREWISTQSHDGWNIGEFGSADWVVVAWAAGLLLIVTGFAVFSRGLQRALRAWNRASHDGVGYEANP